MATIAKFWMQQFVDDTGLPYAGVKVYHYISGTSTDKDVWVDSGKSATAQQPVQGDSRGVVSFYGDGNYRLVVTDNNGILLYDFQDVDILGRTIGTAGRVPYFAADGTLTEDDDFTYNETTHRFGFGTHTNLTERLVMPTNSFLGAERSVASSGEGARKLIGLNPSDHIAIDPDGQGIDLTPLPINSLLYLDSSGLLKTLNLTDGQIVIGAAGIAPIISEIVAGSGITVTKSAGGISIAATGASIIDRTATLLTIASTTTETSLYSFTIAQNVLSTNKMIMINLIGDRLDNAGSNTATVIKIKYGATTLWADTIPNIGNTATRHPVLFTILLGNKGATNSQILGGHLFMGDTGATTGLGLFAFTAGNVALTSIFGSATEDSTTDKVFDITAQHTQSSASDEIRRHYASATLL